MVVATGGGGRDRGGTLGFSFLKKPLVLPSAVTVAVTAISASVFFSLRKKKLFAFLLLTDSCSACLHACLSLL